MLCQLHTMGLLRAPLFLPPWVNDPRCLLPLLTYWPFMNKRELPSLQAFAERLLADAPVVRLYPEAAGA